MILITDRNHFPQCNSCGKETNTLDIKIFFKEYMNSSLSICLCDDCRKELAIKLKECEGND